VKICSLLWFNLIDGHVVSRHCISMWTHKANSVWLWIFIHGLYGRKNGVDTVNSNFNNVPLKFWRYSPAFLKVITP
jgi:hypothetical protein